VQLGLKDPDKRIEALAMVWALASYTASGRAKINIVNPLWMPSGPDQIMLSGGFLFFTPAIQV